MQIVRVRCISKNIDMTLKYNLKILFYFILISITFSSCIFVKKDITETDEYVSIEPIQKPSIIMGDEILRSDKGDMISLLPKDWFFVDLGNDTPPDVFAIAVNPDYSLSLVFSSVKINPILEDIYNQQKLFGIANYFFDRKQKKSLGGLIKSHTISTMKSSHMEFVIYKYRTKSQPIFSFNAVFKSESDNFYEISLIPLNLSGISMPSDFEMEKIFYSVLSTVKY